VLINECPLAADDEEYDLLLKGLEIRKELLPADDPLIADSLTWVGRFLDENCDEVKTALPFFEQALAILEKSDPHGTDCVSAVNHVGCALAQLNRLDEARCHHERAYETSLKYQGERHIETATMGNNLAKLYLTAFPQESFKAIPLLRQALLTSEVMVGAGSIDTAEAWKSLGQGLLDCIELSSRPSKFAIGDSVQLIDDLKACKMLAKGHGGWASDMDRLCGQPGVVKNVDFDGDEISPKEL
jgi:hypothetical protein